MSKKTDTILAHDLRELTVRLYRSMQEKINNSEQLSVAAQNVMYQLTKKKQLLPSELCSILNISSQYMSQVINQLEELDYIVRIPSQSDRRKTLIELTTHGKEKVERSRREREEWLLPLIEGRLSQSEKETISKAITLLGNLIA